MDWLLFLGAGASAADPTCLPIFPTLRAEILRQLGWEPRWDDSAPDAPTRWQHKHYPEIVEPDRFVPPEVVFGTLHRFGVPFARPLERLTGENVEPNFLHHVAAGLLRQGAPVWTPNIDVAVEEAYRRRYGEEPERVCGRGAEGAYCEAAANTLIKFHGSADLPDTLAFTDVELLAPLTEQDAAHLVEIARGRRLVFYGYAGADADLQALLRACLAVSRGAVWFDFGQEKRERILRTFPGAQIELRPLGPPGKTVSENVALIAADFIDFATQQGWTADVPPASAERFGLASPPKACDLELSETPGIVQARIVERFGAVADERAALRTARRKDLLWRRGPREVRAHLRWAASRSFYRGGVLHAMGNLLIRARPLMRGPAPGLSRLRDGVDTFGPALLLSEGRYEELYRLADRAVRTRTGAGTNPGDYYYRAHALRYLMHPAEAYADVQIALTGLAGASGRGPDAERLAGAILEAGILELTAGRFDAAAEAAHDLTESRGRYAIQSWAGWGHWLAGFAWLYRCELDEAIEEFDKAQAAFSLTSHKSGRIDVTIGRLIAVRVATALGVDPADRPQVAHEELAAARAGASARQRADLQLVAADLAIADGKRPEARAAFEQVRAAPPNDVSLAWAELGLAELDRLDGKGAAAFGTIREQAAAVGANWLAVQAVLGQLRGGALNEAEADAAVRALLGNESARAANLTIGDPPVLWTVT